MFLDRMRRRSCFLAARYLDLFIYLLNLGFYIHQRQQGFLCIQQQLGSVEITLY